MYRLFDLIRNARALLQPYTVIVRWEGEFYEHRAWTTSDAREWMAQYPQAYCEVWTRGLYRGPVIVATRGRWCDA
jgi:hypothetical protein